MEERIKPDNWDQMSKYQKYVWRHPERIEAKRKYSAEWRLRPGNLERRKAYWESRKELHRAMVRENNRKFLASMTVEQRRAMWNAEKKKRMQDPEKKARIYAAYKKWQLSDKGRKNKVSYRSKAAANLRRYRKEKPYTPLQRVINSMRARMCSILRGKITDKTTLKYIGCTVSQIRRHLESTFKDGMTWDNYGIGHGDKREWNVDHIIPISKFNLEDLNEVAKALHWTNTKAEWAVDNYKKGNRVPDGLLLPSLSQAA